MQRSFVAAVAVVFAASLVGSVRADEKEALAVVDKAIKAAGGEEALSKAKIVSWKSKGTITFNGEDNPFSGGTTAQGLAQFRSDFEGEFGGNTIKGVTVVNNDKGWRQFADNTMEMDEDAIANEKRNLYLQLAPSLLLPLKGKGFKLDSAPDEKVGDKDAAVVKVTGPDAKTFTIFFDKEGGLPIKTVATVVGFDGQEFTQEASLSDYKDFGGIKRATKSSMKRDGERFVETELTDFKVLDKVESGTFDEPK